MNHLTLQYDDPAIRSRTAKRVLRAYRGRTIDAYTIGLTRINASFGFLGTTLSLVPGLAQDQVATANGAPLVIHEDSLVRGPWAATTGSTGEARLAELESASRSVNDAGGTTIGIIRPSLVPDVNLFRWRNVYDLTICSTNGQPIPPRPPGKRVPRIVEHVRAAITGSEEHNDA